MLEEYESVKLSQIYIIKGEYDSDGLINNIIIEPVQQIQQNKSGELF